MALGHELTQLHLLSRQDSSTYQPSPCLLDLGRKVGPARLSSRLWIALAVRDREDRRITLVAAFAEGTLEAKHEDSHRISCFGRRT